MSARLAQLEKLLEKQPTDTFLLYGIALEHKKANEYAKAIEFLNKVIELDPGYCYAYHQQGLVHESTGNLDGAKHAYRAGIAAANQKGDAHARDEITAALAMIE